MFVNAIMYYKVKNAIHAVANVDDYSGSARLLAATTLRNVLGTMNLGEILSQRESIAREMRVRSCGKLMIFSALLSSFILGDIRRGHRALGRQGGEGGSEGRQGARPAHEGHGCRGRGCPGGQS